MKRKHLPHPIALAAAAAAAAAVLVTGAAPTAAAAQEQAPPPATQATVEPPAPPAETRTSGSAAPASGQASGGGWRKVDGPDQRTRPYRDEKGEPVSGPGASANSSVPAAAPAPPPPGQLMLPAGTWIKARVDQPLSSDRNLAGDTFTATLAAPLVVDGYVVARRGQTVEGRVSEAARAGRKKGTSRLGIEVTHLSLVDGRQMPVRTQLMEYDGGTSVGRDVAAAATVTGTGAAIGAAAGGGLGAGIGALAGAAASAVGVLSTRGRATEIYPEAEIRFRTLEPIAISTERGSQAFLPVRQSDYEPASLQQRVSLGRRGGGAGLPPIWYGGGAYWDMWWGSPFWGRSFWGPSFYFYSAPRWHGGGWRGGGGGRRWR